MCEAFWDRIMDNVKRIAQPTTGLESQTSDLSGPLLSENLAQKTLKDMTELDIEANADAVTRD